MPILSPATDTFLSSPHEQCLLHCQRCTCRQTPHRGFEIPSRWVLQNSPSLGSNSGPVPLVRRPVAKDFDIFRTNSGGETALIVTCQAINNLDHSTLPELLELLESSIDVRHGQGRTLLHHTAVSLGMRGRVDVGRHCLESLLESVRHQGSSHGLLRDGTDVLLSPPVWWY